MTLYFFHKKLKSQKFLFLIRFKKILEGVQSPPPSPLPPSEKGQNISIRALNPIQYHWLPVIIIPYLFWLFDKNNNLKLKQDHTHTYNENIKYI